ncbi:hypothetical protein REIS_0043 [Rickettsia endosymbiont of Ixodes scapularis]|nr:hypothetical protein REIS_0043 [Rickettsia endosymbiont of Ixodes scapularis]
MVVVWQVLLVWALKNLLFGVAASAVGAVLGSFLMNEYMSGNIQKNLYYASFVLRCLNYG